MKIFPRLLILLLAFLPAFAIAQAPTPGEQLVSQSKANLEDLKGIGKQLELVEARLVRFEAQDKPKPAVKHGRGRKVDPKDVRARMYSAFARHGYKSMVTPLKMVPDTFDCRTDGGFKVLPVDDQGQCGDCFGVSTFDGASMALIYAGQLPLDGTKGRLSSQYGLDNPNAFQGGCNGGDEGQVLQFLKDTGAPLTSDYGPYTASPGQPKPTAGMKFYKIQDYGFADITAGAGGVANTALMQAAIVKYGPISVAFDASGYENYVWPQVLTAGGNNVDHAVLCIGWKTVNGKVIFLGMGQWGDFGGPGGTFWIQEGSYSWGVEAMWIYAGAPTPPPPGPPTPPVPPAPGNITLTLKDVTPAQAADLLAQLGGTLPQGIVITPGMTFEQFVDAYIAAKSKAGKGPPKK